MQHLELNELQNESLVLNFSH